GASGAGTRGRGRALVTRARDNSVGRWPTPCAGPAWPRASTTAPASDRHRERGTHPAWQHGGMAARQVDVPGFTGFGDDAFEFYEGLTADNSRTYWTARKHVEHPAVRAPMTALLDALAPVFDATPVIFRPYRDVRFSADKSPYKTAQGAFLEVEPGVGYWISVGADGVTVGGGFHA